MKNMFELRKKYVLDPVQTCIFQVSLKLQLK